MTTMKSPEVDGPVPVPPLVFSTEEAVVTTMTLPEVDGPVPVPPLVFSTEEGSR